MIVFVIVGLLCLSFFLSLFSLWRDMRKHTKIEQVSEELAKGRVIFHAESHSEAVAREIPDKPE